MRFFSDVGIALLVSTLCGCVSMQQRVAQMRPAATQVAQKRNAFELACPAASAVVLSDEMLQTGAAGPLLRSPDVQNIPWEYLGAASVPHTSWSALSVALVVL